MGKKSIFDKGILVNVEGFKIAARKLVDAGRECDDSNVDDENYEDIVKSVAVTMFMGSRMTKKLYIVTGIGIGIAGTAITSKISKVVMEKRKESKIIDRLAEKGIVIDKED